MESETYSYGNRADRLRHPDMSCLYIRVFLNEKVKELVILHNNIHAKFWNLYKVRLDIL